MNAEQYHGMINWHIIQLTEPPSTKRLANDEIKALINSKEKPLMIPEFPCHTQAVERTIKLVTDALQGFRDGFMRVEIEGRKLLPSFEYKRDYNK